MYEGYSAVVLEVGGEYEMGVSDIEDQECSVSTVLAPFSAMRYINDARYLEGDKEESGTGRIEVWKQNMEFRVSMTV